MQPGYPLPAGQSGQTYEKQTKKCSFVLNLTEGMDLPVITCISMPSAKPMPGVNRQITLAQRPVGMPKESDFQLKESTVPRPVGGEVLVQSLYLSVDPYMRGRLNGTTTQAKGVQVG